jgi:hypothetical protein
MKRANYIGAPHFFNLNQACLTLNQAFGFGHIYLVGSSIERRDFRDVDVRCILPDEKFAQLFSGLTGDPTRNAFWSLLCSSISLWLSQHSGLPVDFQIQQQTVANAENNGPRHALGLFIDPEVSPRP